MLKVEKIYTGYYRSPIGLIEIKGNEEGILSLFFIEEMECFDDVNEIITKCIHELDEYFKGDRKTFDINLIIKGTEFQNKVWNKLLLIPYGETASYRDIAIQIDNVKAVRAVGSANGKNAISIIIPCHRVIGANGTLTGYAGGVWRKDWLLEHEKANIR